MNLLGQQALGLIAATLAVNWLVGKGFQVWQRFEELRRREGAEQVLKAKGMEVHLYRPSVGASGELHDALAALGISSHIVLDRDGYLVGQVLPKVQGRESGLRLVVDNKASATKLARKLGISVAEFQQRLVDRGFIEVRSNRHYFTALGRSVGGEYRKHHPGDDGYMAWPVDLEI